MHRHPRRWGLVLVVALWACTACTASCDQAACPTVPLLGLLDKWLSFWPGLQRSLLGDTAPRLALSCDATTLPKTPSFSRWRLEPSLRQPVGVTAHSFFTTGRNTRLNPAAAKAVFGPAYQAIINSASLAAPHHLKACGVLNLSIPLTGQFVKDEASGHVTYQLSSCRLRRLSPPEVLGCLAGRNVAIIGDSLSRFQFISLAHLMARGRFLRPYDNEAEGLAIMSPSPETSGNTSSTTTSQAQAQSQSDGTTEVSSGSSSTSSSSGGGGGSSGSGSGSGGSSSGSGSSLAGGGLTVGAWERFYERTQRSLSRAGCVNTTCRCYRYWRVRMSLEDESITQLSMGLVYAFPDFTTAGINGLRWAFTAVKKAPDMVVFNMGIWWGYVHSGRVPPEVNFGHVVAAFEEVFAWGYNYVKQQKLSTKLVYKTTTPASPVMDTAHTQDNFWWMAWPQQIEPLLIPLARAYGWEVFDAREVVTAAYKQGVLASWDAFHLYPFVYEQLNDLLLNSMCGTQGWAL